MRQELKEPDNAFRAMRVSYEVKLFFYPFEIEIKKLKTRTGSFDQAMQIMEFGKTGVQSFDGIMIELDNHIALPNRFGPDIICDPVMWQVRAC